VEDQGTTRAGTTEATVTGKKVNKDQMVKVRVTEEEAERLRELAEREGLTVSEYLRRRALRRRASVRESDR